MDTSIHSFRYRRRSSASGLRRAELSSRLDRIAVGPLLETALALAMARRFGSDAALHFGVVNAPCRLRLHPMETDAHVAAAWAEQIVGALHRQASRIAAAPKASGPLRTDRRPQGSDPTEEAGGPLTTDLRLGLAAPPSAPSAPSATVWRTGRRRMGGEAPSVGVAAGGIGAVSGSMDRPRATADQALAFDVLFAAAIRLLDGAGGWMHGAPSEHSQATMLRDYAEVAQCPPSRGRERLADAVLSIVAFITKCDGLVVSGLAFPAFPAELDWLDADRLADGWTLALAGSARGARPQAAGSALLAAALAAGEDETAQGADVGRRRRLWLDRLSLQGLDAAWLDPTSRLAADVAALAQAWEAEPRLRAAHWRRCAPDLQPAGPTPAQLPGATGASPPVTAGVGAPIRPLQALDRTRRLGEAQPLRGSTGASFEAERRPPELSAETWRVSPVIAAAESRHATATSEPADGREHAFARSDAIHDEPSPPAAPSRSGSGRLWRPTEAEAKSAAGLPAHPLGQTTYDDPLAGSPPAIHPDVAAAEPSADPEQAPGRSRADTTPRKDDPVEAATAGRRTPPTAEPEPPPSADAANSALGAPAVAPAGAGLGGSERAAMAAALRLRLYADLQRLACGGKDEPAQSSVTPGGGAIAVSSVTPALLRRGVSMATAILQPAEPSRAGAGPFGSAKPFSASGRPARSADRLDAALDELSRLISVWISRSQTLAPAGRPILGKPAAARDPPVCPPAAAADPWGMAGCDNRLPGRLTASSTEARRAGADRSEAPAGPPCPAADSLAMDAAGFGESSPSFGPSLAWSADSEGGRRAPGLARRHGAACIGPPAGAEPQVGSGRTRSPRAAHREAIQTVTAQAEPAPEARPASLVQTADTPLRSDPRSTEPDEAAGDRRSLIGPSPAASVGARVTGAALVRTLCDPAAAHVAQTIPSAPPVSAAADDAALSDPLGQAAETRPQTQDEAFAFARPPAGVSSPGVVGLAASVGRRVRAWSEFLSLLDAVSPSDAAIWAAAGLSATLEDQHVEDETRRRSRNGAGLTPSVRPSPGNAPRGRPGAQALLRRVRAIVERLAADTARDAGTPRRNDLRPSVADEPASTTSSAGSIPVRAMEAPADGPDERVAPPHDASEGPARRLEQDATFRDRAVHLRPRPELVDGRGRGAPEGQLLIRAAQAEATAGVYAQADRALAPLSNTDGRALPGAGGALEASGVPGGFPDLTAWLCGWAGSDLAGAGSPRPGSERPGGLAGAARRVLALGDTGLALLTLMSGATPGEIARIGRAASSGRGVVQGAWTPTPHAGCLRMLRALMEARTPTLAKLADAPAAPGVSPRDLILALALRWAGASVAEMGVDPGLALISSLDPASEPQDLVQAWSNTDQDALDRLQAALVDQLAGLRLYREEERLFLWRWRGAGGETCIVGGAPGLWPFGRATASAAALPFDALALWLDAVEAATGVRPTTVVAGPGCLAGVPPDPRLTLQQVGADAEPALEAQWRDGEASLTAALSALDAGRLGVPADLTLGLCAACILRVWSRWLGALHGSGIGWLLENFIRKPGRVRLEPGQLIVEIAPGPLDVALQVAHADDEITAVPWLRDVKVSFRRGAEP